MAAPTMAPAPPPRRRAGIWPLLAILLLGALLRGLHLGELANDPETRAPALDAAFHEHWAKALATGDWTPPRDFPDPEIQRRPYFRPPGYPHFLAGLHLLTGGHPLWTRALQMLLGLGSVALAFRLGRALFGPAAGLVASFGLATGWHLVYFDGELLAPTLLIALLLGGLLALHRWLDTGSARSAAAAGVLFGALALSVPNALALLPVVWLWAAWIARKRREPRRSRSANLVLPLAMVLCIAPATLRNALVAGEFVLVTSNGGVNLYIGNNPEADGTTARIPILRELAPLQGWTCFDEPAIARGASRLAGRPLGAAEVSRWFTAKALDFVAAEPGRALGLALRKTALFWGPAEPSNNREDALVRAASPVLRWLPTFPIALALALLGAARLFAARRERPSAFPLLLLLLTTTWFLSHVPFFVAGRYRVPLLPILWLAAGAGVADLVHLWRTRGPRAAAPWLLALAALLAAAHAPLVAYTPDRAQWHFQRGDAFRRLGELDAAIGEFEAALAANAQHLAARTNLGGALLVRGDVPRALEALREAVHSAPDSVEARTDYALALVAAGQDGAAIAEFGRAVSSAPELPLPRLQLGGLLLRAGRAREAVPHLETALRLSPDDERAQYLLGCAQGDAGDAAAAHRSFEALVAKHPRALDGLLALAESWLARGEPARARELLQRAQALDPAHPGVRQLAERLR